MTWSKTYRKIIRVCMCVCVCVVVENISSKRGVLSSLNLFQRSIIDDRLGLFFLTKSFVFFFLLDQSILLPNLHSDLEYQKRKQRRERESEEKA